MGTPLNFASPTTPQVVTATELAPYLEVDLQGKAQSLIEFHYLPSSQLSDRLRVQALLGNRQEIVAVGYTLLGEAVIEPESHLRGNVPDGSSDGSDNDGGEHGDGGVSGDDEDGPASCRRAEIGPADVASPHQLGVVSAAKRLAVSTRTGSWGTLV